MPIGTIIKWVPERGFGFVEADGEVGGMFLHISKIDPVPEVLSAEVEEADRVFGR